MWFYRSPYGTFKVASIGSGFCLLLGSQHLRDFQTADDAFKAVAACKTGFKPWDEKQDPQAAHAEIKWIRNITG